MVPVKALFALTLTALVFLSCAPKDEKLIRPDSGGQLKTESITSDVSIKLAFAAFDRTTEAVVYLKALLNPEYATQKNLILESISAVANQSTLRITSGSGLNETSSFVQTSELNLLAVITRNDSGEMTSVLIKDDSGGQSKTQLFTKNNSQKSELPYVISVSKSKRYLITKSDSAGIYTIETDSVDSIKSFNRKNLNEVYQDTLSEVSAKLNIQWDGKPDSLNQKIQIIAAAPEYQPQLSKVRTLLVTDGPVDLAINLNECSYLEGQIALTNVKTKSDTVIEKQILLFSSSSVSASGKPTNYKWTDCKSRPLIDLTGSL